MSINENNIIYIQENLPENTNMVLIRQDGKQFAIPTNNSPTLNTSDMRGLWLDITESSLLPNTPVIAMEKAGRTYVIPVIGNVSRDDHGVRPLTFTAQEAGSTVVLEFNGASPNVYYRTSQDMRWVPYSDAQVITIDNVDDYVQFWNESARLSTDQTTAKFTMTGKLSASGSVQSMLNWSEEVYEDCFRRLFYGCTSLTGAPDLPATTLAAGCYKEMFRDCNNLLFAPKLPATTLIDNCYESMFSGCTSLTGAPDLPATELFGYCYYGMFSGCASLTKAPELPATELAYGCYSSMFKDCSSLLSAPKLPAAKLELYCYHTMFSGCTSIESIEVNFTEWGDSISATTSWCYGVSTAGTFKKPSTLPVLRGANYIPQGWTVQ